MTAAERIADMSEIEGIIEELENMFINDEYILDKLADLKKRFYELEELVNGKYAEGTMSEELKPCPFCGGNEIFINNNGYTVYAYCDGCGYGDARCRGNAKMRGGG